MSEESDIFAEFLTGSGLRFTAVRRAIVDCIEAEKEAFSASDLQKRIRIDGTVLNRATLYRNLVLLKAAGVVEEIPEKISGRSFYRLKKVSGRVCELHCSGRRGPQRIDDPLLDAAILSVCERYHLCSDGVRVSIEARRRRGEKGNKDR